MVSSKELTSSTLRRLVAGAAASLSVLAVSAGPAGAQADPEAPCTYADLVLPPRVGISSRYTYPAAEVETDCWPPAESHPENLSMKWKAHAPSGRVGPEPVWYHSLSNPTQRDLDPPPYIFDHTSPGRWTWRPVSGYVDQRDSTRELTADEMNTPAVDVRVTSRAGITATRSGGKVTVSTRATRFWTSTAAFGTWGGAVGLIQYRVPGTTPWLGLKNVASDPYGRYSYTYTVSARREYRVLLFNATHVFGGSSTSSAPA
ncbi:MULTISPECIES: hypothetical protein [unclassified Knoellia]|uniref:hypothetical protein n=1 Tax=Knoellia altitudinis TaxID=3404795 RepID=UPI00361B0426